MARPERFELPTPWFVARYSIQLSYGRNNLWNYPNRGIGLSSHLRHGVLPLGREAFWCRRAFHVEGFRGLFAGPCDS